MRVRDAALQVLLSVQDGQEGLLVAGRSARFLRQVARNLGRWDEEQDRRKAGARAGLVVPERVELPHRFDREAPHRATGVIQQSLEHLGPAAQLTVEVDADAVGC